MTCPDPNLQLDESLARQLQIEEFEAYREIQSGKWTEDSLEAEVKKATVLIKDPERARSIAKAVDSDAVTIEEATVEETQSVQDRDLALSLNEYENLPSRDLTDFQGISESAEWDHVSPATEALTFSIESCSTDEGPSTHYAPRQRAILKKLSQLIVECIACRDLFHPQSTVRLLCGDVYCRPCLKDVFLHATKDESLFPPKCHRQQIDILTILADFSVEEFNIYRSAELEFTSTDRVYCADPRCAKFIPMPQRTTDRASCEACGGETCMHCKALAHDGDCPADEARQSLINFADEQGWKPCFGCGEMVFRYEGGDHMTCRCGAEFCYRCGAKWKECPCGDSWAPELLNQRAEQVVDREAPGLLEPAFRQQHVVAMERELQKNHECDHSGKFTQLAGSRRGKVCQVCGTRHRKYILSCKRCHMLACEDCRSHLKVCPFIKIRHLGIQN